LDVVENLEIWMRQDKGVSRALSKKTGVITRLLYPA
jgi:hypothetical protein